MKKIDNICKLSWHRSKLEFAIPPWPYMRKRAHTHTHTHKQKENNSLSRFNDRRSNGQICFSAISGESTGHSLPWLKPIEWFSSFFVSLINWPQRENILPKSKHAPRLLSRCVITDFGYNSEKKSRQWERVHVERAELFDWKYGLDDDQLKMTWPQAIMPWSVTTSTVHWWFLWCDSRGMAQPMAISALRANSFAANAKM